MLSANYTPPPPKKRRSRSDSAGPPNKKQREEKQGLRVVLDATECIRDTGREVVVDNFFTSVELARKLKERNLFLTGTVRRCKPDIPRNMLPSKTREVHSTTFGYNDQMMMASYVPKKNKTVVFLTTNPELKGVDATSTKKKAYVNLHYNAGKAAVDNLDKVTREFTVSRRTKRWPVKVFYDVLDVMIHNALVIFSLKNPEISNRKQSKVRFMQLLAYELAEANVKIRAERAESGGIHNELKNDFKIFFSEFARLHQPKAQPAVVNDCYKCGRKIGLERCTRCEQLCCQRHRGTSMVYECVKCQGDNASTRSKPSKTCCYYCTEELKRSRVECSTCKVCCCDEHRLSLQIVHCDDCRPKKTKKPEEK